MQTINNTTSEDARKGEGSNGQLGTEIQSSRADGTKGCNQLISSLVALGVSRAEPRGEWAETEGERRRGEDVRTRAGRRRRRAGRRRRTAPAPWPRRSRTARRPSAACPRSPPAPGAAPEATGRRAGPTSEPWGQDRQSQSWEQGRQPLVL
jgi:hypothetical protein